MRERDHRELWEQLKVLVLYSKQTSFTRKELYKTISDMELGQLFQNSVVELFTSINREEG